MESNMEGCKVPRLKLARNPQVCCVTLGKSPPFSGLRSPHFVIKRLDQVNSKVPPLAITLELHTSALLGCEPPGIKCSGHCLPDQWGGGVGDAGVESEVVRPMCMLLLETPATLALPAPFLDPDSLPTHEASPSPPSSLLPLSPF